MTAKKRKPIKADDPPTTLKVAVKEAVVEADGTAKEATQVAATLKTAIVADPVLQNALNQEPWYQSGVGVFGTGGLLWSLGFVLTEVAQKTTDFASYDYQQLVLAVGTLTGFGAVLYRRFMPGLKPMFHGWGR